MYHQNIHEYTCTTYTYIHHQTHVHYIHYHTCTIYKYICHMYHQKHTCTTYTYMHHQTHVHHQIPPKYKIYQVGLPSVLYETPGPNEICVESAVFGAFHCAFHFSGAFHENCTFHENCHFSWKPQCFSQKPPLFMKTATVFIVSFWVITKYRSFVRKTKQMVPFPLESWHQLQDQYLSGCKK